MVRRIALQGTLDHYGAVEACRILDVIDGPAIVDLTNVRILGAAGLSELAKVGRRVGPLQVTLVGVSRHVARVLQLAKFNEIFTVECGPRTVEYGHQHCIASGDHRRGYRSDE